MPPPQICARFAASPVPQLRAVPGLASTCVAAGWRNVECACRAVNLPAVPCPVVACYPSLTTRSDAISGLASVAASTTPRFRAIPGKAFICGVPYTTISCHSRIGILLRRRRHPKLVPFRDWHHFVALSGAGMCGVFVTRLIYLLLCDWRPRATRNRRRILMPFLERHSFVASPTPQMSAFSGLAFI